MTAGPPCLRVDDLAAHGLPPLDLEVHAGEWQRVRHPRADAFLPALAGTVPAVGRVLVAGADVTGRGPAHRSRAGLATVAGRLPDAASLRVGDVVLLARRPRTPWTPWLAAAGLSRAAAAVADEEAAARALAGRMGLSAWFDRAVVGVPPQLAALADVARAVAAAPHVVVWRRPQWLPAAEQDDVGEVLAREQRRLGFGVVELEVA